MPWFDVKTPRSKECHTVLVKYLTPTCGRVRSLFLVTVQVGETETPRAVPASTRRLPPCDPSTGRITVKSAFICLEVIDKSEPFIAVHRAAREYFLDRGLGI